MDIKAYLKDKKALVDSFLKSYFRRRLTPPALKDSMLYSLLAGGKRLRPILAMASYEACGKDPKDIIQYASALELIHTYSLIHDDLPAMDDDDLRRGRPTNHKVFGEAMAILAGDALLTEAFRMLSEPSETIKAPALIRAIQDVSSAAGVRGMVAGQAQDIISENTRLDKRTLSFIHRHKTGALITASVRLGGTLAGAGAKKLSALTRYGEALGLAFQITDDILDVEGETQKMGKTAGSDVRKGKLTYPGIYGLEASKRKAGALIGAAGDALNGFPQEAGPLRAIAGYISGRSS